MWVKEAPVTSAARTPLVVRESTRPGGEGRSVQASGTAPEVTARAVPGQIPLRKSWSGAVALEDPTQLDADALLAQLRGEKQVCRLNPSLLSPLQREHTFPRVEEVTSPSLPFPLALFPPPSS